MRFLLVFLFFVLWPVGAFAETAAKNALFAGGNFWVMQDVFDRTPGVLRTVVGYTGGRIANPVYADVVKGRTGHRLAVLVIYDPAVTSFEKLLQVYWHNIDPVDTEGQFCDRGLQFSSAVYYANAAQKMALDEAKMMMEADNSMLADPQGNDIRVGTVIRPRGPFYPAEIGQQSYYEKNPLRYRFYLHGCQRDKALYKIWGRPKT